MGSREHSMKSGSRWARRISATAVVVLALASVSVTVHAAVTRTGSKMAARPTPSVNLVPFQYIAKAYTELLGRAPAAAEWARAVQSFETEGCTTAGLIQLGDTIVASSEYRHDYPSNDAGSIALTLYRFVLNREPNEAEYVAMRNQLTGTPTSPQLTPADAPTSLYERPEFATLTQPAICNATDPSYYFGKPGDLTGYPAITTPSTGAPRPAAPGAALQQRLDTLSLFGGGVVVLPERQVVGLATTLTIPGNVTLTTAGNPDPTRYADMARLVRLPPSPPLPVYTSSELVRLDSGAKLVHLWVDGQRDGPDPNSLGVFNIRMLGGVGTTVQSDRIGNSYGASNLEDDVQPPTTDDPTGCKGNVVSDNLVEGYATAHGGTVPGEDANDHPETDGFGIYCGSPRSEVIRSSTYWMPPSSCSTGARGRPPFRPNFRRWLTTPSSRLATRSTGASSPTRSGPCTQGRSPVVIRSASSPAPARRGRVPRPSSVTTTCQPATAPTST